MRLLLALILAASLHGEVKNQRRAAHPQIYALTDLARSTPPEFAARGLLQLLDADAIPDREWRLELASEVLTLAASARHPVRKRLAPGITAVDNRAMLWNVAYNQGLDALSLSIRAIDHIRRIDPIAARKAFAQLPRPAPSSPVCKDALLDDVSAWYAIAGRLNADPLPLIQSIQTHSEIASAIDLIFQRRNSREELDTYAGAVGQQLRALPQSERAFSAALFEIPRKLKHLYTVLASQQRPTAALSDGWRAWMQSGFEAPACQESRLAGPQQQARQDALDLFNQTLEPALPFDLLKTTGEAVAANLEPFADNEGTREQTGLFKSLLFGNNSRALSEAEKDTPEWREGMQKYIQSIEARTRSADESGIEYFYRQSQLWAGILMASPAGPTRDRALERYIGFLLANAPHIDPLIWFSQVESMAGITRSLHGTEYPKVLNALRLTAHPVLQLYAELEAVYPTRPGLKVD
ncbi:MAG: hypothetical protein ACKV2U_02760 [Bryobacteraceae bacterium]